MQITDPAPGLSKFVELSDLLVHRRVRIDRCVYRSDGVVPAVGVRLRGASIDPELDKEARIQPGIARPGYGFAHRHPSFCINEWQAAISPILIFLIESIK